MSTHRLLIDLSVTLLTDCGLIFAHCSRRLAKGVGECLLKFHAAICVHAFAGEESLMIFVDKRKMSRTSEAAESNGTAVTLEALHQLAASYFIDRESTLHKLHHIQIASTAIKVNAHREG